MTEGLKTDPHQPVYIGHLTPSPDGHSPYTATRHRGRGLKVSLQIFETPPLPCPVALWGISVSLSNTFKTPPLCFVTQNIGEVARSDGGVENSISSAGLYWSFTLFSYPLKEHFRLKYSGLWKKTKKESIGEKTKSTCDQTATDAYT